MKYTLRKLNIKIPISDTAADSSVGFSGGEVLGERPSSDLMTTNHLDC